MLRVLSGLRNPNLELAQLLFDHGADPNLRSDASTYGLTLYGTWDGQPGSRTAVAKT